MELPFPFALLSRIWTAIRQNPCTIEILDPRDGDKGQWIRVRNDSTLPVQLFDVSFAWRLKGRSKFDEFHTPLVWVLSERPKRPLEPGHSFEHPVDAHELGEAVEECRFSVRHNRSRHEEVKRFRVR